MKFAAVSLLPGLFGLIGAVAVPSFAQVVKDPGPNGQAPPRIVKVERTLCVGSVVGQNRDGSAYAWNCRGLPMIRLTLDDGSVLGPLIGVTVDTVGDPLVWQSIPVDVLKTATRPGNATPSRHASGAQARSDDPFYEGQPFSIDDILQRIGVIADKRLIQAIGNRGISFVPDENDFQRLRRAGAGGDLIQAVLTANRSPSR